MLIDLYMPIVDDYDKAINDLEDRVVDMRNSNNEVLGEMMDLRRSVARLKRISSRQLDVLYRMSHGEFPQIPKNVLPFFRPCARPPAADLRPRRRLSRPRQQPV